jgi:hypothetical protein
MEDMAHDGQRRRTRSGNALATSRAHLAEQGLRKHLTLVLNAFEKSG